MNELKALRQGMEIAIKNGVFVWEDIVSLKVAFDRVTALVEKGLKAEEGDTPSPKIPNEGTPKKPNLKKK